MRHGVGKLNNQVSLTPDSRRPRGRQSGFERNKQMSDGRLRPPTQMGKEGSLWTLDVVAPLDVDVFHCLRLHTTYKQNKDVQL